MSLSVIPSPALFSKVIDVLATEKAPAISDYDLGRLIFAVLKGSNEPASRPLYQGILSELLKIRLLTPLQPVSKTHAYLLFGKDSATPQEVICSVEPFAYLSHLSAMEYHGLTDRFPKILYFCTPPATDWRNQARARVERDLASASEEYSNAQLPQLVRPTIKKIGSLFVEFHDRTQQGAFRKVHGSAIRVATIGRVFLDMLREPRLCGGIQHVLDIYQREAKRYLPFIVDEIEAHGKAIDKVRAGYVLEELCNLHSPVIERWEQHAQRGGSRKLDAEADFSPIHSPKWQLSINVSSLSEPNR